MVPDKWAVDVATSDNGVLVPTANVAVTVPGFNVIAGAGVPPPPPQALKNNAHTTRTTALIIIVLPCSLFGRRNCLSLTGRIATLAGAKYRG
jgi:hypothetical protein